MLKEYRKTATIKAEQFDGSEEMMNKYGIYKWRTSFTQNSDYVYYLPTKEGDLQTWIGCWIATGIDGEHWAIADDIFRKTYVEVGADEYIHTKAITDLIIKWGTTRGILPGNASKQLNKLVEELGELAEGFNKDNREQVKDSLGDMFVVMTLFAKQNDLDINDCIDEAYQTIKDRVGKTVDGVFVKESDLSGSK